jgi:hypothetical protein
MYEGLSGLAGLAVPPEHEAACGLAPSMQLQPAAASALAAWLPM